jgi:hypothetical protein
MGLSIFTIFARKVTAPDLRASRFLPRGLPQWLVLSHIVVANGQSQVSPKRYKACVANRLVEGQFLKIGTKRFSLAPPHVRAKGTAFFIDKSRHRTGSRIRPEELMPYDIHLPGLSKRV